VVSENAAVTGETFHPFLFVTLRDHSIRKKERKKRAERELKKKMHYRAVLTVWLT
jgi:hypothetical protein